MDCPYCKQKIAESLAVCPHCQNPLNVETANPYAAPAQTAPPIYTGPDQEGDATGGVIPYKNPMALIAYYCGIASGLPLIGLPLGIAAFILGIKGLQDRKKNPAIKGSAHAWIGIGCGGVFAILWGLMAIGLIASLVMS